MAHRAQLIIAMVCAALIGAAPVYGQSPSVSVSSAAIAPQPLASALKTFALQTGLHLIYPAKLAVGLRSPGASAGFAAKETLRQLLRGTGLKGRWLDDRTVSIEPQGKTASVDDLKGGQTPSAEEFRRAQRSDQHAAGAATRPPSDQQAADQAPAILEEIVVTAEKRKERLLDAPVPITVLDARALVDQGQASLQDYYQSVPGLNYTNSGQGVQAISIRGLSSGESFNPTVGVTIDDVPFGSSTSLGNGSFLVPDIDPSDLARVEVLRGPQGTLYGASSLGGLLNFVTVDPSTSRLSGQTDILGDAVSQGDSGYAARASVNIPLSNDFALGASGFARRDPGYIENVITGQSAVNREDVRGGRLASLWLLPGGFSLKLGALLQDTAGYGVSEVDAHTQVGLAQARMPNTGRFEQRIRFYTASLTGKLAGLDFTSLTGYSTYQNQPTFDASGSFGAFSDLFFNESGTIGGWHLETTKFSQEFRLASPSNQKIEWLVGAFFTHESSGNDEYLLTADPRTGTPVGLLWDSNVPTTFDEYAAFGDLTVHFTSRFDIQFGGRQSYNRQRYQEIDTGPFDELGFGAPSPVLFPKTYITGDAFTFLVTPRLRLSDRLMAYVRVASGYRVGGPNAEVTPGSGVPAKYDPDTAINYELGVKGEIPSGLLTYQLSGYYIDWRHIQTLVAEQVTGLGYTANAGDAYSQGVELSLAARPASGLSITLSGSVNDAKLSQNFPNISGGLIGHSGDRLPYSSPYSANLLVDQTLSVTGSLSTNFGGSISYVGERYGEFGASPAVPRGRFPAYGQLDLHAGILEDSWRLNLFANNVTDKRGVLDGDRSSIAGPYYLIYTQPRTIGLSIHKDF